LIGQGHEEIHHSSTVCQIVWWVGHPLSGRVYDANKVSKFAAHVQKCVKFRPPKLDMLIALISSAIGGKACYTFGVCVPSDTELDTLQGHAFRVGSDAQGMPPQFYHAITCHRGARVPGRAMAGSSLCHGRFPPQFTPNPLARDVMLYELLQADPRNRDVTNFLK